MIGPEAVEQLIERLWPSDEWGGYETWAVLDGARSDAVHEILAASYRPKCAVPFGNLDVALQRAAPQLLQLRPNDLLTRRLLREGWGRAWGIFLRSSAPLPVLRRHLASLLRVRDEQHRRLIFRFYDPRVLRIFLPTCFDADLPILFGSVFEFLLEGESAAAVSSYRLAHRQISARHHLLSEEERCGC